MKALQQILCEAIGLIMPMFLMLHSIGMQPLLVNEYEGTNYYLSS
jgi:hypothetical protein